MTYPKQGAYANIARAQVNLPHSEFLDQGNIGKACTKVLLGPAGLPGEVDLRQGQGLDARCSKSRSKARSTWSAATATSCPPWSPNSNGQIRVLLVGKVDTGKNKGIRNTFEAVPDAPVERFVLEMKGGKKYGLLENSEDVCRKKQMAGVVFTAQNGKTLTPRDRRSPTAARRVIVPRRAARSRRTSEALTHRRTKLTHMKFHPFVMCGLLLL